MPLKVDDRAPDFQLSSTSGEVVQLNDFKGKPLILFFYPKDFTPGCTKEVCEFRDAFAVFRELDIQVLGVSRDSIASHLKFKDKYSLPFELLSDADASVAAAYKATIPVLNMSKRVTYLLDSEHKIKAVYENMFGAEKHIKQMIAKVK